LNKLVKMEKKISNSILLGIACLTLFVGLFVISKPVAAQIELKGIDAASNLAGSFNGGSLARDSRLNEPLDLLNDFYPSIDVRFENSSNIQRSADVARSDTRVIVNPSLGYRTNIGRHEFYAAYNGQFQRHFDFTQEDSNSNDVRFKLGLDISSRWDLDLFGAVGSAREERGVSGTRDVFIATDDGVEVDQGPDRISYETVGFDVIYGRKLERFTAVFGYEQTSSGFRSESGSLVDGGDRDRVAEDIHLDLDYRIGANTSVFARIDHTDTDFDRLDSSLDSEQRSWLVGFRIKPSSRLSGVVGYGQTDRNLDDRSLNGFDGNTYYANVTYALSPFSSLQFGAARSVEEPGSVDDGSFFVSELLSLSWQHSLTDHLTFDSYVKFLDDDFEGGRRDEFVDWGVGLDYVLRHWLTVGVYYEDIDRDSNVSGVAFEDRIFGIRFTSDLRSLFNSKKRANKSHAEELPFHLNGRSVRSSSSQ